MECQHSGVMLDLLFRDTSPTLQTIPNDVARFSLTEMNVPVVWHGGRSIDALEFSYRERHPRNEDPSNNDDDLEPLAMFEDSITLCIVFLTITINF